MLSKYAFVFPLKDKKGISIVNAFNKIIKQSNRKPNKIWVDQGGEFYNHNFKNGYQTMILLCMTATGKNVHYDVLDDIVNEYNNTKHNTIKMKPKDVGDNKRVHIDEHNEKDTTKSSSLERSRFKVGDRVRISKFKNIFAKGYTPNWSKEIFIVDKINDTVPYTYNIKDLNDEEIIGSFYDRELQKNIL